jgi:hypothetical protein
MRMMRRMVGYDMAKGRWFAALFALLIVSLAGVARAQPEGLDEEQGRELAIEAMAFYKQADYEGALGKFEEAEKVYPTGQVLRMKGYALLALSRWLEAARALDAALSTDYKPLMPRDAEHATEQRAKALTHISSVSISSVVDEASVSVDGETTRKMPITVRLEPGKHRFVVSAPEHEDVEVTKKLAEGQQILLDLDPKAPPSEEVETPAPRPKAVPKPRQPDQRGDSFGWFPGQGTVGLIAAGAGLVAGGVAIGLGVYGVQLDSAVQENIDIHNTNYDASCTRNRDLCLNDITLINRDGERAAAHKDAALATGIVGVGLLAAGVTLFLLSDDSPLAPDDGADRARLRCTPSMDPRGGAHGTSYGLGCFGSF